MVGQLRSRFSEIALRGESRRRAATALPAPCELDADVDSAAAVNARPLAVNTNSKAYRVGYAAGVAAACEEAGEVAFSTQAAGNAGDALLKAVGFTAAARMLGVGTPLAHGTTDQTTVDFQVACHEYNVGYATGWDAGEATAVERMASLMT